MTPDHLGTLYIFAGEVMPLLFNGLSSFLLVTVVFCSYYLSFVAKLLYIINPPQILRAVSQNYLKCCLLGCRSRFGPNKI